MTDAVIESLRLRGSGAARLSRVAATTLPAALDRALAGIAPVRIESLSVLLDLDPRDYDDETLATLWADAIRAQVLRHAPDGASGATAPDAEAAPVQGKSRVSLSLGDAAASASAWLAEGGSRVVPADALALADLLVQMPLAGNDAQVRDVLVALAAAVSSRPHPVGTTATQPPSSRATTDADTAASVGPVRAADPQPGAAPRADTDRADRKQGAAASDGVGQADASHVRAAVSRVAALAELVEPGSLFVNLDDVTSAAGLALLYPWLGDLCRRAVDLHPGLDEAAVRAHALAALVDPSDLGLVDDPLVRFLAGVSDPLSPRTPLTRHRELSDEAERVLASFANLLPGFGQSSPEFVRDEWIRRIGLLDSEREPAQLTATTHPLDVMLIRLPYPLTLFKLPWSPPLMVRFQP